MLTFSGRKLCGARRKEITSKEKGIQLETMKEMDVQAKMQAVSACFVHFRSIVFYVKFASSAEFGLKCLKL